MNSDRSGSHNFGFAFRKWLTVAPAVIVLSMWGRPKISGIAKKTQMKPLYPTDTHPLSPTDWLMGGQTPQTLHTRVSSDLMGWAINGLLCVACLAHAITRFSQRGRTIAVANRRIHALDLLP